MPEQWKESIIVPIYKKGDKTDRRTYRGISLLSVTHRILTNIRLSGLTPYSEKITEDHQSGFQRNGSTTDHIFCICRILEKKWEYSEALHQLFVDSKKAYDSVWREGMCNILTEFGIPMKLVRPIKMCLNEMFSRVWVGRHLSYMFPIKNGLK